MASISRYLGPGAQLELGLAGQAGGDGELSFVASRRLGGAYVLDALWRQLGIDTKVRGLLAGRRCDPVVVERVLFALVAHRALDPGSKLAATRWVAQVAAVPGLDALDEDAAYRAMDLLLELENELGRAVFFASATLLDLEVDLLFFDSTSTYFERDTADAPVPRDAHGQPVTDTDTDGADEAAEAVRWGSFRAFGHSKDSEYVGTGGCWAA